MEMSYQYATVEQIAAHFSTISRQAVHNAIKRYSGSRDVLTYEKIVAAKAMFKAAEIDAYKASMCTRFTSHS